MRHGSTPHTPGQLLAGSRGSSFGFVPKHPTHGNWGLNSLFAPEPASMLHQPPEVPDARGAALATNRYFLLSSGRAGESPSPER